MKLTEADHLWIWGTILSIVNARLTMCREAQFWDHRHCLNKFTGCGYNTGHTDEYLSRMQWCLPRGSIKYAYVRLRMHAVAAMETGVGKLKSYKRHTLKIWGLALSGHDGRGSILVSCLVA